MPNVRTLVAKGRPVNKEQPNPKEVARIYFSAEALQDLRLKPGQTCYVWKTGDAPETKREAIAWISQQKSVGKKAFTMWRQFQHACGFNFTDDMNIAAGGELAVAESIVLKDLTAQEDKTQEIPASVKDHWKSAVTENLWLAETLFPGMTFSLLLRGVERTFMIELLNGRSTNIAKYSESSVVEIRNEISEQSPCRLEVVDIAGMDQALEKLNRFLSKFDRKFRHTAPKSCAVLLHGGPGTGKTFLLDKIAHTGWGKVYKIKKNMKHATIQTTFQDAKRSQPSLIVIDDLESLISNEDPKTRDISESLGEELDNLLLSQPANTLPRVLVIASTQEAGRIPISLKKRGRFNRQILLPLPDAAARREILKSLDFALPKSLLDETLDKLGDVTHAYSAGDLVLLQDAANEFFEDRAEENKWDGTEEECHLSQDDIEHALLSVRPTAMHDITLQPPKVKWEDIGGQESVKSELREAVEAPLLYPLLVERAGALPTKGILMYGPPGCSKTLIAQAMATEAGFNFFAVKGAELLNMYVGESERQVREIFSRARAARPSIIFFDEVESIGGKREGHGNPGVNVLTTLLNEMDGIETLKGVMVLAATNKPQALDLALLRPGRFDELLYVSPPDFPSRKEILNIRTKKMAIADDVDINELARLTDGYSGAELVSVCSQASKSVVRKSKNMKLEDVFVRMEDLLDAIKKVKKQITPELVRSYEQWAAGVSQATN